LGYKPVPRDGAIIFADLIGRLDVLYQVQPRWSLLRTKWTFSSVQDWQVMGCGPLVALLAHMMFAEEAQRYAG
jgi:hypothetical protein